MKQVRAWLRMTATGGDYPAPTSEADYLAHLNLIDAALPTHGGQLEADGTWTTFSLWESDEFCQALPGIARAAGHAYLPVLNPGHGTVGEKLMAVLDADQSVWEASTDQVVAMATETRFDAPWDGVIYDSIGFSRPTVPDYIERHQQFLTMMSNKVRAAGLSFGLASHGQDLDYFTADLDLGLVAEIADTFDYYFMRYRAQPPSICPYWWIVRELEAALSAGMAPSQMYLGIPNFAAYYPDGTQDLAEMHTVTHAQAVQIVGENSASIQWIEDTDDGLYLQWSAQWDNTTMWISDGDTVRPRLGLADYYGLPGMMLAMPGMGDESIWRTIADWKRPASKPTDRFYQSPNWCA